MATATAEMIVCDSALKKRHLEEEQIETESLEDQMAMLRLDLLEEKQRVQHLLQLNRDLERECIELNLRLNHSKLFTLPPVDKDPPKTNAMMPPPPRPSLPPLPESDAGEKRGEQFTRHWVNRDAMRSFEQRNVIYVAGERRSEILVPKDATDHDLIKLLMHYVFCENMAKHDEWRQNFDALRKFMYEASRGYAMGSGIEFKGV